MLMNNIRKILLNATLQKLRKILDIESNLLEERWSPETLRESVITFASNSQRLN